MATYVGKDVHVDQGDKPDLEIPLAVDGFVKTLNNTGYVTTGLDRFSQAFVDLSASSKAPVMDVGAACCRGVRSL